MPFLDRTDELWQALAEIAEEDGLELYDVERSGASALRVVIERPGHVSAPDEGNAEAQARVTSGDCSKLCRRLMVYFSVEGPRFGLGTEPEIEVSSPGVNRNLRLQRHFDGAIGERVKLVMRDEPAAAAVDEKRKRKGAIIGKLTSAASTELKVVEESSGEEMAIDRARLKSARVDFKF